MKKRLLFVFVLVLVSCNVFADFYNWDMPAKRICDGLLYAEIAAENPNQNVYCVRIDTTKNFKFYTTPRITDEENYIDGERETWKMTTRNFMRKFQTDKKRMLVAVNNDFFSPWPPKNAKDPANLVNFSVSDGVLVSSPNGYPAFVVRKDGTCSLEFVQKDQDISDIWVACGANSFCLQNGEVLNIDPSRQPRTLCGMSEHGKYIYLMVIDGRRHKSVGASFKEEGEWMKYFGAWNAINFDGGGSSTMCWWDMSEKKEENRCKLLNQPNGNNWINKTLKEEEENFIVQERSVGNSLGVYIDL